MEKVKIEDREFTELFSESELMTIVDSCVKKIISSVNEPDKLVIIGVLNGAVPFTNEIVFKLPGNVTVDYIKAVSYGDGTTSGGSINMMLDSVLDLNGKDVIVVDDIIDTGLTINFLVKHFKEKGAGSVRTCCLFYKRSSNTPVPNFYGKEINEEFIVGFGLDYAQKGRNIKRILRIIE